MKLKTLNSCILTGAMYVDMVQSYVEGINGGMVPNIETAWTYISKNECQKAMAESLDLYD